MLKESCIQKTSANRLAYRTLIVGFRPRLLGGERSRAGWQ